MQTEHTSANIELKPKRTTKDREEQRREKQRQESESKKVQRQRLMAAIAEAANAGRDRSKLSKSPREGLPAQGVVPSEYLTTQQAAAYLNISRQYLEAARYRGDGSGPAYVKLERAVRYRRSVLDAWMSAHNHSPDAPIITR
jgi:Helix-turn-helix domain